MNRIRAAAAAVAVIFLSGGAVMAETKVATFAGGCFWCMTPPFENTKGVTKVVAGYTGGKTKKPSYEEVCSGETGHAEAVEVTYDPAVVTYDHLLDVFWRNIDPTTENAQFADHGTQYRTAIFFHDDEQKRLAEVSRDRLAKSGKFSSPIVTEIVPAGPFYPAEDYHQDYLVRNPDSPYIRINDLPKIEGLKRVWPQYWRAEPVLLGRR